MKIRKEIGSLSPVQLRSLRDAWRALERTDEFQDLAGLHGLPNTDGAPACPHGTFEFLPWHRLFLVDLENRLEVHGYDGGLPYWRWTRPIDTPDGIPAAFTDDTYESSDGSEYPNPLRRGWIRFEDKVSKRLGSLSTFDNEDLQDLEDKGYAASAFWSDWGAPVQGFGNLIEAPHDDLHEFVGGGGGAMSSTARASYDPIFWAHHSYVDQQWASWQSFLGTEPMPDEISDYEIRHYMRPIASTLDYRALGYEYDELGTRGSQPQPLAIDGATPVSLESVPFGRRAQPSLEVILGGLRMIQPTLKLHVFIDGPDSVDHRPSRENPHFVRTVSLFGMGGAMGPGMFMGEFTRRADIGPALLRLGLDPSEASIQVVAVDEFDQPADLKALGIKLTIKGA